MGIVGCGFFVDFYIYDGEKVSVWVNDYEWFMIDVWLIGFVFDFGNLVVINWLGIIFCGMDSVVVYCYFEVCVWWVNVLWILDVLIEIVVFEFDDFNVFKIVLWDGKIMILLSDGCLVWD